MKIGIVGNGNVGSALAGHWTRAGHEVRFGVREPEAGASYSVPEIVQWGEVVVLAIPYSAAEEVLAAAGDFAGKVLIDCTNPIAADFSNLTLGLTTSAGEQNAARARGAKVVKAFNTVGANIMENPDFGGAKLTMLIAGDDPEAKKVASALAAEVGFDPEDAGPLEQARLLESFAWLWITMALKYGHGRDMAFQLVKR